MDKSGYDIGYGKPPEKSRFKKGETGNPKGRPKGTRNLASLLNAALDEKVIVNENGRKRKVTKLEASLKQVVNRATTGDLPSMRLLLQLVSTAEGSLAERISPLFNHESDKHLLSLLLERSQYANLNSGADPAPPLLNKEEIK